MKNFNLELISKILRQLGGLLIVLSGTVFYFKGITLGIALSDL